MPPSPTLLPHPDRIGARLMQKAHNRDGLPEIATGLCFLLSATLTHAQVILPARSPGFVAACLLFSFALPALIFAAPKAIVLVRNGYLVGRTGYVKTKAMRLRTVAIGTLLAIAASILLFGMIPKLANPRPWLLAGAGFSGGVLAFLCGRTPRFVVLGAIIALTGIAVASSHVSLSAGFAILWGVSGLAILVSGSIVFVRFLRMPPGN